MKNFFKKTISCLLITAMMLSVLSIGTFAAVAENEIHSTEIAHIADDCTSHYVVLGSGLNMVADDSLPELPEDTEAYCYTCDTCKENVAADKKKTLLADGTYGNCYFSGCDGKFVRESLCAKIYCYKSECSECGRKDEYEKAPEGTEGAPYGVCKGCGTVLTKEMFWVSYVYRQYSRPCFYCYNVLQGTKSIYDVPDCPFCGESYDMTLPASVDADGNLIYGGGGSNLYYCTQTKKFYEAPEDENENVIEDCPYCDSHQPVKIKILYCATCPSCGMRTERAHLDFFKRPHLGATLNNAFMAIGVDISGTIDPTDFDLTNTCYNCKYNFTNDKNIVITRHVDAPDGAVYEESANDRDFHETDYYMYNGSEYDNFFERLIWAFKKMMRIIKEYFEDLSSL